MHLNILGLWGDRNTAKLCEYYGKKQFFSHPTPLHSNSNSLSLHSSLFTLPIYTMILHHRYSTTTPFCLTLLLLLLCHITCVSSQASASCKGQIEVMICLDMSGSFDNSEYLKQTDFAVTFVDSFSDNGKNFDGDRYLKIGVMGFSSNAKLFTESPMLSSDYAVIKKAIKENRQSGGTKTELCFNHAGVAFDLATRYVFHFPLFSYYLMSTSQRSSSNTVLSKILPNKCLITSNLSTVFSHVFLVPTHHVIYGVLICSCY